jgi:hypothetical protein
VSAGYNVIGDTSGCGIAFGNSDVTNTNMGLGALQDNGGPAQTIGLLASSPALDLVPVAACIDAQGATVSTDERGSPRPSGPACDAGAFEDQQALTRRAARTQVLLVHRVQVDALNTNKNAG